MCCSNHESFIVKKPLRPFSSPQLFSTRQRRGWPLTTSTPVKSIAWVISVWWYRSRSALGRSKDVP
jgi:hypothetical protein